MATAYHLEALRRQRLIDRKKQAQTQAEHDVALEHCKPEETSSDCSHRIPPPVSYEADAQSTTSVRDLTRPKSASSIVTASATINIETETRTVSRQTSRPVSASSVKSSTKSVEKSSRPSSAKTGNGIKTGSSKNPQKSNASQKSAERSRPASATSVLSNRNEQEPRKSSLGQATMTSVASKEESQLACSQNGQVANTEDGRTQTNSRATKATSYAVTYSSGKGTGRSSAVSKQSWTSKAEIRADEVRKDLHKQELVLRDSNLVMGDVPVNEEVHIVKKELQLA